VGKASINWKKSIVSKVNLLLCSGLEDKTVATPGIFLPMA